MTTMDADGATDVVSTDFSKLTKRERSLAVGRIVDGTASTRPLRQSQKVSRAHEASMSTRHITLACPLQAFLKLPTAGRRVQSND